MKICCSDCGIGAARLEQISDAYDLFKELMKRNLLGPENTELLVELLDKADRIDLKNIVLGTQGNAYKLFVSHYRIICFTSRYISTFIFLVLIIIHVCVLNFAGSARPRDESSSSGKIFCNSKCKLACSDCFPDCRVRPFSPRSREN